LTSVLLLLSVVCCASSRLAGDTVYYGTGADSKVFAANVLVRDELTRPDRVAFWYNDFVQPIGLKVRSCESAKCRAVKSSPEERDVLIESWKANGAASITDHSGRTSAVYDLVLRETAPPGYFCFGCRPEMAFESFWLRIGRIDGPAKQFRFDAIRSIRFVTASDLDVVLRTGERVAGYLVVESAAIRGATASNEIPLRATFTGWQQLDSNTFADFTIVADEVNRIEFRTAVPHLANSETSGASTGTAIAPPVRVSTGLPPDGREKPSVRDEVDRIRTHEHVPAPPAQRASATTPPLSGKTIITFKNSIADELHVFLDGPTSVKLTLAAGSSQKLDVSGGVYRVAGRVDAANILPFYGEETYASSAQYSMEFYIAFGEKR
jgi:hypothetical protein